MIYGWVRRPPREPNTYMTFCHNGTLGRWLESHKASLSPSPPNLRPHPLVIYYWPLQGITFIVVLFVKCFSVFLLLVQMFFLSFNVAVSRIVSDVFFAIDEPYVDFRNPGHTLPLTFPSFRLMGMVGEACLPSNAYYPRTPYPFILASVSVGLNILNRHSFADLWVWITAWV